MNLSISLLLIVLFFGFRAPLFSAEPQPPLNLKLNPDIIQPLSIHPKVDLLLLFPEEVTLILGQGLTSGENPGQIQFQHGEKNPKLVTLRLLDPKADVLMRVVLKQQVFGFRLRFSEQPLTTVRFSLDPTADKKAHEITKEESEKIKRPVSMELIKQMANMVGREPHLRAKLPEAYANYDSREVDFSSPMANGLVMRIQRIARFVEEDTLVFFGELRNERKSSYEHPQTIAVLKVGLKQTAYKTMFLHTRKSTPAGESTPICLALVGDGKGNPLHLSLKNEFSIQLKP